MTRLTLLALLIAACCRQPPPASLSPPTPGPALVTRPDGRTYAVIHFLSAMEEASGLGGEPGFFVIDDPASGPQPVAPGGGHGPWYRRGPDRRAVDAPHYFVAQIGFPERQPFSNAAPDGHWGTMSLEPYKAEALALVPMPDLATARAQLPELARTGMPDAIPVPERLRLAYPH